MTMDEALLDARVSVRQALTEASARLREAGVGVPLLDARLLLEKVTGLSREKTVADPEKPLSADVLREYQALVARRCEREPMAHILGVREFWGLNFQVTDATLDPRPDSETLIEVALSCVSDRQRPLRLLDLGTGTGCLLISLLTEFPAATGLGLDVSAAALEVAEANAAQLGVAARTQFLKTGDWGAALAERFDVVIANPPYIPENEIDGLAAEVSRYEPRLALSGGGDGLDAYRAIAAPLPRLLAPFGVALLEIGAGQMESVAAIMQEKGLRLVRAFSDLAGIPRCLMFKSL